MVAGLEGGQAEGGARGVQRALGGLGLAPAEGQDYAAGLPGGEGGAMGLGAGRLDHISGR